MMKDGSSTRDWHEIDDPVNPGDFVASGEAYPLNKFTLTGDQINLFVEAINPSASPGDLTIAVSVDVGTALPCLTDTVTLTAAEIEVHDLRHWGPSWDSATGVPRIQNPDLDATNPDSQVGGAITDGTSICLLRLTPTGLDWPGLSSSTLTIQKRSDTALTDTRVIGNLETATTPNLPDLPNTNTTGDVPSQPFSTGKLFYIPPDNYIDRTVTISGPELNAVETCSMEFVLTGAGSTLARIPFILRRPPLVLVHGIVSSPATWDPLLWNEMAGSAFQTRVYKVDWSVTQNGIPNATKGYENFYFVSRKIEDALIDYRTANDGTHDDYRDFDSVRYAATRADVVGHSQGGQLTRFYIADSMPTFIDRIGWLGSINNDRDPNSTIGKWPFLRDSNFGAGSIRRFITLGSPFKGSKWADLLEPLLQLGDGGAPGPIHFGILQYMHDEGKLSPMVDQLLFPNGSYVEPTCAADLTTYSQAMQAMETASYPSGHKQIRWYPIVGIGTEAVGNAPVQSVLWELLFTLLPLPGIGGSSVPGEISDTSPVNSDIIVPAWSQRNISSSNDSPSDPSAPGKIFENTAHSVMPGFPVGETNSVPIREHVFKLLYGWPSPFDLSWSIGP